MSETGLSLETATSRTGFVRGVGDFEDAEAMREVTEERFEMRVEARAGEAVILLSFVVEEGLLFASVSAWVIAGCIVSVTRSFGVLFVE